ncbi:UNVERIFIED_CONTAM: Universal stress protein PHOS34 [Sesamum calycinum]|uniref:Universal stress protein PHOS34 n=1 Tax=Sesamum calycinum TaxID=2727403 RepID=A0AAW2Q580_9LAMI
MQHPSPDSDLPPLAAIKVRSSSPRFPPPTTPLSTETPTANAQRKIGIAVDLSDESAFAVKWSVRHYLRPGDAVILLHVRPTSVLYGLTGLRGPLHRRHRERGVSAKAGR